MRIQNIIQAFQSDLIQKKDVRAKEKPADTIVNKDVVSISSEARDLQKVNQSGRNEQPVAAPEVRIEKVEAARTRIAEGYYSTPQILARLAERLLKEFNI